MKTKILSGVIFMLIISLALVWIFDLINRFIINSEYYTILFAVSFCLVINLVNIGSSIRLNNWLNFTEKQKEENK